MIYRTFSSRLSAGASTTGSHLDLTLSRSAEIVSSLLEELILHDQVYIRCHDFLTLDALILIFGENGVIELFNQERIRLVRIKNNFSFMGFEDGAGQIMVYGGDDTKAMSCDIEKSLSMSLDLLSGLKEKKIIHETALKAVREVTANEIYEAVRMAAISDFKASAHWKNEYNEKPFMDFGLLQIPEAKAGHVRILTLSVRDETDPIEVINQFVSYNLDLILGERFKCGSLSPYFDIQKLIELKLSKYRENSILWKLLRINGVPDLTKVTLEGNMFSEFLTASNSNKARNFRRWFHSLTSYEEEDVLREFLSVIQEVHWVDRLPVKCLRLLVDIGIGLADPLIGIAYGVFDSFLDPVVKHYVGNSKIKCFLNDLQRI